jgi:hypothetical protein
MKFVASFFGGRAYSAKGTTNNGDGKKKLDGSAYLYGTTATLLGVRGCEFATLTST